VDRTGVESEEEFGAQRPQKHERLAAQGKLEARVAEAAGISQANFSKAAGFMASIFGLVLLALALSAYLRE
jgi:hypothetical protein